ncbi:MAG: DUF3667 domain-containing protein [Ignavibacteriae bacterium]|nr:DUF3667 domain-containing protein [Ignavibacteriota bacterium]
MKLNKSKHCLNCHNDIDYSTYCPYCGQLNTDKKITLREMLKDFLGDYFTFDSKFFKSLIPLLIKPGHLTHEYLKGKRVSYILPLRLYIFTTFVFFFVVSLNTKMDFDKFSGVNADSSKTAVNDIDSSTSFDEKIANDLKSDVTYNIDSSKSKKEVIVKGPGFNFSMDKSYDSSSAFVKYLNNKSKYLASFGEESSTIFWKEVINQIPKVMFILLPLFALFLKLLYLRKKILYVEHIVFSLHIHTFIFIILIVSIFIPNTYIIFALIFLILIYLFLSLLNFYQQSIIKTSIKFILLLGIYVFALLPTFLLLAILAMVSI